MPSLIAFIPRTDERGAGKVRPDRRPGGSGPRTCGWWRGRRPRVVAGGRPRVAAGGRPRVAAGRAAAGLPSRRPTCQFCRKGTLTPARRPRPGAGAPTEPRFVHAGRREAGLPAAGRELRPAIRGLQRTIWQTSAPRRRRGAKPRAGSRVWSSVATRDVVEGSGPASSCTDWATSGATSGKDGPLPTISARWAAFWRRPERGGLSAAA